MNGVSWSPLKKQALVVLWGKCWTTREYWRTIKLVLVVHYTLCSVPEKEKDLLSLLLRRVHVIKVRRSDLNKGLFEYRSLVLYLNEEEIVERVEETLSFLGVFIVIVRHMKHWHPTLKSKERRKKPFTQPTEEGLKRRKQFIETHQRTMKQSVWIKNQSVIQNETFSNCCLCAKSTISSATLSL